ncbi:hypothetical protein F0344_16865 [Streptomyces finlayi]|uniref:Uncharacterized protein n=1 Tax=Streptomyces finlayi TaxID=67296 RepID=A0A7G7BL51_9ACTN|nr:hypothetical protein [Streptomyces finlayi]QNE76066.1 hypothetical protein F0344_16865 [Streptomyces finlayi]
MHSYTRAESRERGRLFRKGFHQSMGDNLDPRVTARMHEIDAVAKERGARELAALLRQQETARDTVAAAKAAVRASKWGPDRSAAKDALRDAEKHLRRAERAYHRAENS